MPHVSDQRLLVLHGLRLEGFGEHDAIAAVVGVAPADVARVLDDLAAEDLAVHRDGPRLAGWALTAAGRDAQEAALAAELDTVGGRDVVHGAYTRFLALNAPLLEICTAWQMIDEATLNDHSDPDYDNAVIKRLVDHHAQLGPILDDLEDVLDRYGIYRPRFDASLDRLQSGEHDWFTKPMIDSYHTVWFQLHEDLLNTLGIERASEGNEGSA